MKSWGGALRDAWWSGALVSVISTAVLALFGRSESGSAFAPTNAISHWFWGDRALHQDRPSIRYTLAGYATHHLASVFWAVFYERWFGAKAERGDARAAVGGGLTIAALACFVDYQMTPRRLQPGYEARLSNQALVGVYGAIAIALAVSSLTRRGRQPERASLPWRAHARRMPRHERAFARPSPGRSLTQKQTVL
ncbi:MAG TPA: hypothetical protein VMV45_11705 [Casimicrobiaceae bacterium]|nr:hypothetical protein [Casimicrobiaceae bacterium]